MLNNVFFFPENHVVYQTLWENILDRGRAQVTWRMRIACWKFKAKNAHTAYIILVAFLPQRWLYERASVLRYTYIACLVVI